MSTNELTALCDSESCLSRANKKSYMSSKGVEKDHVKRTESVLELKKSNRFTENIIILAPIAKKSKVARRIHSIFATIYFF